MQPYKRYFEKLENEKYKDIDYKTASKLPKGGAVNMDFTNLNAGYADVLAHKFGMRPEAVYNWGKKFNFNLRELLGRVNLDDMIDAVLNTKPLIKKGKMWVIK